ncbi:hypothetical protein PR048_015820 [Dryococelus australis]|uniref:Uncharacterized protein n=1 Tax=Dryococelus australis TaxID=614101 RepID=A0ABQ9HHZ9_9NEOP|nr:hypothetical protein PR048_015820 [Dryococelus australis]
MVLAKNGAHGAHIIGNEHGAHVTIVLVETNEAKFADGLPAGSICSMTPKGSMTTQTFNWLHHFRHHKPAGRRIRAKNHLDYEIVNTSEQYDIVFY